ncbi:MAG: aminoacetone oxidase family FAD-binding enzyme [Peptostreptococcus sp.]|uniref:NAD(P)/FAD-dependent oxidoreductase n=1 Tax=Peptostreptococcus TaxID=1257 RepID=UPI00290F4CC8|nr:MULTISPECIES: aminoacetone oxidase family FAD-binding enzyme [Peptostreptococcus]MDU3423182.1 aminoacetone oxidase family FAD-binding enzyme [Peptostreptococcus anaerobius]MDU3430023.1 aminoacetone oxidase family FAD-binding enzyme [Peptostreptococcus sp.]MDU3455149.1 aminoacetone oxidase family FAD-binding enzyme [Peptostreptococcus sp.]MDU5680801.1 aminoacetone oxidase family FAD-binding enzyme [Peptostreptococcus sp.]MDU5737705.1 aminoacetone oxidase family FAD-binding enzyme [Peptostrep
MQEFKKEKKIYDILIVGGGPSGIMAALSARKVSKDLSIGILDSNTSLGKKLKLTGGGRCNFTNNEYIGDFFDKIVTNDKFLYSALYSFTNEDLKDLVISLGLDYIVEEDNYNKVYIGSGRSEDFIVALTDKLIDSDVAIYYNKKILDIQRIKLGDKTQNTLVDNPTDKLEHIKSDFQNTCYSLQASNGQVFYSRSVILASGGKSFKNTGSDGSVLDILSNMGYNIIDPRPGLVPINLRESWFTSMAGISFKNAVLEFDFGYCKVKNKSKHSRSRSICGDIIITHKGIGGPASLKMSSLINRLDFKDENIMKLDLMGDTPSQELYQEILSSPKQVLATVLRRYLPKRYVAKVIDELDEKYPDLKFNFKKDKLANMSKKDFEYVLLYTKNIHLRVDGIMGIEAATITSGGVSVKNVNPSTMESKIDKGIYFAGEMLDVDAFTGGYNLQIAFSTGYLAGISAAENLQSDK